jgi:hypothetical protein
MQPLLPLPLHRKDNGTKIQMIPDPRCAEKESLDTKKAIKRCRATPSNPKFQQTKNIKLINLIIIIIIIASLPPNHQSFASMPSGGKVSTLPFLTSSQLVLRLVPLDSVYDFIMARRTSGEAFL